MADGCDHNCAFCTIPTIKGRQVSKPPLHVLQEIVDLVAGEVKEIVLVAQDHDPLWRRPRHQAWPAAAAWIDRGAGA